MLILNRGFTLVELLLVVALLSVVIAVSALSIREYAAQQQLRTAQVTVLSILREVRQQTLAAETSDRFGIHVSNQTLTRFEGSQFTPGELSNRTFEFTGVVLRPEFIPATTTLLFARLTGVPSAVGYIEIEHERTGEVRRVYVTEGGTFEVRVE